MSRKYIKEKVIKRLYALSNNHCAFPDCKELLFDDKGTNISNVCHIEAAEEGGTRYNPNSNDEYRRSFENLILLCANHHKVTDNTTIYTVDKLKEMKKKHEIKKLSYEIIFKRSYVLGEVVQLLSNNLFVDEAIESSNKAPDIENKISYNKIKRYKGIIKEYTMYQGKLNNIYAKIEKSGSNKKAILLQSIRNLYLQNQHIENADDILDKIKEEIYTQLEKIDIKLSFEVLETSIFIIMVDAFMRCKILKEPKNDN